MLLLHNPLGYLPQAFKQEQGRFHGVRIDGGSTCVICQAGGNPSVIPIGQADNQVRIAPSANTDELHALAVQRVVRVGDCDPFQRWLVKGSSVL
jgi:hypothetical protein